MAELSSSSADLGVVLGVVGCVTGVAGALVAWRANAHAKSANEISEKSNGLAGQANVVAREAVEIARRSLEAQEDATKVRLLIECEVERQTTIHSNGTRDEAVRFLVHVINHGVQVTLESVGLRAEGWKGFLEPRDAISEYHANPPLAPRGRRTFAYTDRSITGSHRTFYESLQKADRVFVRTVCGVELEKSCSELSEWKQHADAKAASGKWWREDGHAIKPE